MSSVPSETSAGVEVRAVLAGASPLGLRLRAGGQGVHRKIIDPEVQTSGLSLSGVRSSHPGAVFVLGRSDHDLLVSSEPAVQRRLVDGLLGLGVPAVVLCRDLEPPQVMLDGADAAGIPLLTTLAPTGRTARTLHDLVQRAIAPQESVHGVLVQVHSVGVLLTGPSGIGKSETALELVLRGHRLVADDRVVLTRLDSALVGAGPEALGHFVEIRGLGVLNAADLFGEASVVDSSPVDLLVELVSWEDVGEVDRTGLDPRCQSILDVDLPKVVLPVRPGRNLAAIVEVAARNHILRTRGVTSARRFDERLRCRLEPD